MQPDLHPIVALEELDRSAAVLLNLLEEVLTMQPDHLDWVQIHYYFSDLLFGHLSVII